MCAWTNESVSDFTISVYALRTFKALCNVLNVASAQVGTQEPFNC